MATIAGVRSLLHRYSAVRTAATRFTTASKPKSNPFSLPNRNSLSSPRIFRSPVELSSCVESLRPYHTATASALLTSMLSVTPRHFGWTMADPSFILVGNDRLDELKSRLQKTK